MKRKMVIAAVMLLLLPGFLSAQWLHVRVNEEGERVGVNVPIALINTVLPLLESKHISRDRVGISHGDINLADLREIWDSLRQQGDFRMATITTKDVDLEVSIESDFFVVRSTEAAQSQINVSVPLVVVDALFSAPEGEFDWRAAADALLNSGAGNLVEVKDGRTNVRIWIDNSSSGR